MSDVQRRLVNLHRENGRALHGLFFRLTLDGDAAADLLQDLYAQLTAAAGFAAATDPVAYAYRAAFHLISNHRRTLGRNRPPSPLQSDPPAANASPAESVARDEEFQQLLAALESLPDGPRQAFTLHHVQQLPYEEVARILEISAHSARALTHRALQLLRERFSSSADKGGTYARLD